VPHNQTFNRTPKAARLFVQFAPLILLHKPARHFWRRLTWRYASIGDLENPMSDIKESDWKIFRKIKEDAILKYCERCLSEYSEIISDSSKDAHERYLYLYRVVENRDKKLDVIFGDNTSRSKAPIQLLAIRGEGLANPELVSQLSSELEERTDPKRAGW
jgi:hypothetical protein